MATKLAADIETLKLTVDEKGIVWYLDGDGMPYSSGLDHWTFLKSPILQAAETVRVPGSASNSALIHQLFERRLKQEFQSLQLCSPLCCESAEERRDPEIVLYRMRCFRVPPSLGGWHEMDIRDLPSYLLSEHFQNQDEPSEFTRKVVIHHPAWSALTFIEDLDIDAVSCLLGLLIDPRWYIDMATDPNRGSRMEQFLDLNPRNQSASNLADQIWANNRCKLVTDCWKTAAKPIMPAGPRAFLWRVWASKGGGTKGDLSASKLFLAFLRLTWLQAVCSGPQAPRLFVPKYFFMNSDEAEAYEAFLEEQKQKGE